MHNVYDRLVSLKNDPVAFEQLRTEIIAEFFENIPPKHRASCLALQRQIDIMREEKSPQEVLDFISRALIERLEDAVDQFNALSALLEKDSPEKPRLQGINEKFTSRST